MVIGKCTDVFRGFFWFGGGVEGKLEWGLMGKDLSMEEFVMGEENFMKGVQDFLALFKKKQ